MERKNVSHGRLRFKEYHVNTPPELMILSVVTSMFLSSAHLRDFHRRMTAAVSKITHDFEIILVNDGSPDDSLQIARDLHAGDPRTKVIDLSRNFGQHRALMTGLAHASGDRVFMLDCDLEEAPELINVFQDVFKRETTDVVYGVREKRHGGWQRRWAGDLFYRLFNTLSGVRLPPGMLHARLMSRRFVDALLLHRDREPFILALCQITGFTQTPVSVEKTDRGTSSYSLWKRVRLAVVAMTSFSGRIFSIMAGAGFVTACLCVVGLLWLYLADNGSDISLKLVLVVGSLLWASLMFSVGVLGIYVWKLLLEKKGRPAVIVRETFPPGLNAFRRPL